jgi:hypothetical protein
MMKDAATDELKEALPNIEDLIRRERGDVVAQRIQEEIKKIWP